MQYLVFDSNVSKRWRRVKDFVESMTDANFWVDIKKHTRSLLKDTMELCMDWEMIQHIGNETYKRKIRGQVPVGTCPLNLAVLRANDYATPDAAAIALKNSG